MKQFSVLLLTFFFSQIFSKQLTAQECSDCRYISQVFDSLTKTEIHFGRGTLYNGDTMELYADVYEPYGDTMSARPVLIFAFGGAFAQGDHTTDHAVQICEYFAHAGYVAVSIDYRNGIDIVEIISGHWMRIFFRPMQDMRAAVQYMKADYSELGNNFRIDTSRIVIAGASSGGITALMVNYCDTSSELAEMGNLNSIAPLGGFYSTTGFYPNYSWSNIGTVSVAGALINAEWVEPGNVPVIMAHGDADNVVPYAYGPLGGGLLGGFFDLQGSYVIDSVAKLRDVCSYLYTMAGQDHPSESLTMNYIHAVVTRIMQRMKPLIENKTFCCTMTADIQPGDTLNYAPGSPDVTLNVQITNAVGTPSVHWCGLPCSPSGTNSTLTVTPDSTLQFVSVLVDDNSGCEVSDLYILQDSTQISSVEEVKGEIKFSVYPVPNTGEFTLTAALEQSEGENAKLEITDALGRKVFGKNISAVHQQLETKVDVRYLPAGNYFLHLISENGKTGSGKIVITK